MLGIPAKARSLNALVPSFLKRLPQFTPALPICNGQVESGESTLSRRHRRNHPGRSAKYQGGRCRLPARRAPFVVTMAAERLLQGVVCAR
jgi:hypothetical protein